MKKSIAILALGILLSVSAAWADNDPDLEGRIRTIDVTKSIIVVKNELQNKIGPREYRVLVKQGMINNYMKNDKLKIWLMADRKEAKRIEKVEK